MNDIEKQILENELALALDAAQKGDKARLECGAMEMQIKNLKNEITRLESEAMYGAAAFQAAKEEIKRLKDECEKFRKDAERYRWLRTYCYGALTSYEMSDLFSHNDEIIDEKVDQLRVTGAARKENK